MKSRRAIVLLVLAAVVGLTPLAMAFGGCAGMAQMCEAPCGASASAAFAPRDSMATGLLVARLEAPPPLHLLVSPVLPLDPPPKSPILSA